MIVLIRCREFEKHITPSMQSHIKINNDFLCDDIYVTRNYVLLRSNKFIMKNYNDFNEILCKTMHTILC